MPLSASVINSHLLFFLEAQSQNEGLNTLNVIIALVVGIPYDTVQYFWGQVKEPSFAHNLESMVMGTFASENDRITFTILERLTDLFCNTLIYIYPRNVQEFLFQLMECSTDGMELFHTLLELRNALMHRDESVFQTLQSENDIDITINDLWYNSLLTHRGVHVAKLFFRLNCWPQFGRVLLLHPFLFYISRVIYFLSGQTFTYINKYQLRDLLDSYVSHLELMRELPNDMKFPLNTLLHTHSMDDQYITEQLDRDLPTVQSTRQQSSSSPSYSLIITQQPPSEEIARQRLCCKDPLFSTKQYPTVRILFSSPYSEPVLFKVKVTMYISGSDEKVPFLTDIPLRNKGAMEKIQIDDKGALADPHPVTLQVEPNMSGDAVFDKLKVCVSSLQQKRSQFQLQFDLYSVQDESTVLASIRSTPFTIYSHSNQSKKKAAINPGATLATCPPQMQCSPPSILNVFIGKSGEYFQLCILLTQGRTRPMQRYYVKINYGASEEVLCSAIEQNFVAVHNEFILVTVASIYNTPLLRISLSYDANVYGNEFYFVTNIHQQGYLSPVITTTSYSSFGY